ncbi:MAG: Bug family tripartite tricarboxylate transporter substrate binding protein [Pseudolabrys sp.]
MRAARALALAVTLAAFATMPARADTYPSSKITLIVAFAPGGVADTLARLIGQGLSDRLHEPVVVENRGGAGGNIAAGIVARAQADGYTLLVTTTALAINATLHEQNPFKPEDFVTVAIAASSPEALVTSPDNPAKDLADLVRMAKERPVTFGSAGVGSGSHVEAEYFLKELAHVNATHVPFQGGAPAINATLGRQIDLLATTLGGAAAAQIKAGKLKGLGIAADKRAAVVPDVPTYAEQGFAGFTAASWVGVFAPARTDPKVVATLNAAILDVLKSDAVQQRLTGIGFDPLALPQPQAQAMFAAEIGKWGGMVRTLGLSVK